MRVYLFKILLLLIGILMGINAYAAIRIVAAENMYGEVAKELGGPYVEVTSILNNPNQDPHLFTTSPSTAIALTDADIIIYNGANYDPWINPLLTFKTAHSQHLIVIAELMQIKNGSNPHLWYLPETMPLYAKHLTDLLSQLEPSHRHYFQQQLRHFNHSYQAIFGKIKQLEKHFAHTSVIATEPVFNYMTHSIGLRMHSEDFQMSIMNDVPPTFSQVKQFEDELRHHNVRVLIYNNQVINPATKKMLALAEEEKIPTIGVSETMPSGMTYVQWILRELDQLEKALART